MADFKIALTMDNGRAITYGLSTDTKLLTVPAGSTAMETDSPYNEFIYNGSGTAAGWVQIGTDGAMLVNSGGLPSAFESKIALFDDGTTGQALVAITTSTGAVTLTFATDIVTFTSSAGYKDYSISVTVIGGAAVAENESGAYAVVAINSASNGAAESTLTHTMNLDTSSDLIMIAPTMTVSGSSLTAITRIDLAGVLSTGLAGGDREGLIVNVRLK